MRIEMFQFKKLLLTIVASVALCACEGADRASMSTGARIGASKLSEMHQPYYQRNLGTGIASRKDSVSSYEIYVTNAGSNELTTYKEHGERTKPTIEGLSNPQSVAVDAAGKIYVANLGSGSVTTYNPDGSQASPTISGLRQPIGIAVDAGGKIYITERSANRLSTFNADGSPATPTIRHVERPGGVAVSSSGLIYVASTGANTVTTYEPDGTQTTPTISDLINPIGISLGDNDYLLYVVQKGTMTVYEASTGASAGPAVSGLTGNFVGTSPGTRNRKIFIANTGSGQVNAYRAGNGFPSEPNITKGLSEPNGITIH